MRCELSWSASWRISSSAAGAVRAGEVAEGVGLEGLDLVEAVVGVAEFVFQGAR
jgi:hypothetical protein